MALALNYWEQTSNALINLFDLQCWASTVNISGVVEPSIRRTEASGVFSTLAGPTRYTFRDLFDLDHWNSMSLKYSVSPLVSLQNFLENAARDIVYVQITYHIYENAAHCHPLSSVAKDKWAQSLRSKGFRLAKTVCFNFLENASMNDEMFHEKIFKGTNSRVVATVIFERFKGLNPRGASCRLMLTGPRCSACARKVRNLDITTQPTTALRYTPLNSSSQIVPSKRIVEYTKQFISEQLSGERYIAVMLRTEKLKSVLAKKPDSEICANKIISDWKELVAKNNIHKTLLFSDTGSHGSLYWTRNQVALNFSSYVEDALHLDLNLNQVNSILEKMTGSKDSVQIAALHRQLAVHATCVVMIRSGVFQSHTLNTYFHNHRGQECFKFRNGLCNSLYINQIYGLGDK